MVSWTVVFVEVTVEQTEACVEFAFQFSAMISISKLCGTTLQRKNAQFPSAENCDFYGLFFVKAILLHFSTK